MLQYHQFDITADGTLSHQALDTGTRRENQRATFCAAGDGHSLTLTLPRHEYFETSGNVQRTEQTLHFGNVWLPLGPVVFPTAQPHCTPDVNGRQLVASHDVEDQDGTVDWLRASRSDAGWVVVYFVPGDEQDHTGASFQIARPKTPY
jgi:hypothetical protein